MDQFNIDLPALIGSRICHDLIWLAPGPRRGQSLP